MSAIPIINKLGRMTAEEYFRFDEKSETRYEFNNGLLRPMGDRSKRHNLIVGNVHDVIRDVFRPRGNSIYTQSVKLEVVKNKHYAFPDVTLICHDFDSHDAYIMTFPSFIVEIAEPLNKDFYQGTKFQCYQHIPSLKYYLIIEERFCSVSLYSRSENPKKWSYEIFDDIESIIDLPKLNFSMSLSNIYERINFDPAETWDL